MYFVKYDYVKCTGNDLFLKNELCLTVKTIVQFFVLLKSYNEFDILISLFYLFILLNKWI